MNTYFAIFVLLQLSNIYKVIATGILKIKFKEYNSKSSDTFHDNFPDYCCGPNCDRYCDFQFHICVTHQQTGEKNCLDTDVKRTQSGATVYDFGSQLNPLTTNPWELTFPKIRGKYDILFRINALGHVFDEIRGSFTLDKTVDTPTQIQFSGSIRESWIAPDQYVKIEYSAACNNLYLPPDCLRKKCVATDDITGHFKCDSDGNKICLDGWKNITTNCTIKNITISSSSIRSVHSKTVLLPSSKLIPSENIKTASSSMPLNAVTSSSTNQSKSVKVSITSSLKTVIDSSRKSQSDIKTSLRYNTMTSYKHSSSRNVLSSKAPVYSSPIVLSTKVTSFSLQPTSALNTASKTYSTSTNSFVKPNKTITISSLTTPTSKSLSQSTISLTSDIYTSSISSTKSQQNKSRTSYTTPLKSTQGLLPATSSLLTTATTAFYTTSPLPTEVPTTFMTVFYTSSLLPTVTKVSSMNFTLNAKTTASVTLQTVTSISTANLKTIASKTATYSVGSLRSYSHSNIQPSFTYEISQSLSTSCYYSCKSALSKSFTKSVQNILSSSYSLLISSVNTKSILFTSSYQSTSNKTISSSKVSSRKVSRGTVISSTVLSSMDSSIKVSSHKFSISDANTMSISTIIKSFSSTTSLSSKHPKSTNVWRGSMILTTIDQGVSSVKQPSSSVFVPKSNGNQSSSLSDRDMKFILFGLLIFALMIIVVLIVCLCCLRKRIRGKLKHHDEQLYELRSIAMLNKQQTEMITLSQLKLDENAYKTHHRNSELLETTDGEFIGFQNALFAPDVHIKEHEDPSYKTNEKRPSLFVFPEPPPEVMGELPEDKPNPAHNNNIKKYKEYKDGTTDSDVFDGFHNQSFQLKEL